jgi:hypothetical protein
MTRGCYARRVSAQSSRYWIAAIAAAALAAFLFIDHRHTFLLPETLYCSLGLSSSYSDFGRSVTCWKCPGFSYPALEPFCDPGPWRDVEQPCPPGIKPIFYCPHHYSVWGGLVKMFQQVKKAIAGNPYHS